jgi:hypothetical protein
MGSFQCGSHGGTVFLRDGIVWAECRGRMAWQRYDGPAADCNVGYGFGRIAREIAAYIAGHDPRQELRLRHARMEAELSRINQILGEALKENPGHECEDSDA